jgi:hypothetical protein
MSEDHSDAPFAVDNSVDQQGLVHGWVIEPTDHGVSPIEDAQVCVVLSIDYDVITSKCTLTAESGEYTIPVKSGIYTLTAMKQGYATVTIPGVHVWANETTEVNFSLQEGTSSETIPQYFPEYRERIYQAVKEEQIGGELIIRTGEETTYENIVLLYNSVVIQPLSVSKDQIIVRINGDENSTSKVIIVTIASDVFDPDKTIMLEYDGIPLTMAQNISDILNPNDDGSHPEYLLTKGSNGTEFLLSIPHFSEHELTFSLVNVVETMGSITAVLFYLGVVVVSALLIFGIVTLKKRRF